MSELSAAIGIIKTTPSIHLIPQSIYLGQWFIEIAWKTVAHN
jgi:hypothetical protein